ncbi:hypothetical protein DXG03_006671 [Asterophora parasitica]|uniref:Beta-lactamase-related domain-containing protein n=1 Tax=Asterophora parasitica TaxID=117018 RepID=A0A9P7G526_9AGAR|nr:hypothetical protein DXG03_006671 [Asterophora parasitica]
MRFQSLLGFVTCCVLYSSLSTAQQQNKILDAETDAFINKVLADWKSPGGAAVAFVRKNDRGEWVDIEYKGYGKANPDGRNITENTTFNIGSNSKLFTVLGTSLIINNASVSPPLDWHTKIKSVIPEFNLTDPFATHEATVLDLMTHRTGYPLHDFSYRYTDVATDAIRKLQYQRQSAPFRDIWQYNNNMYITLSHIPELLVGKPFGRYIRDNIFVPLGMNSTTYSVDLANSNGQRADGMSREGLDPYVDPFAGTPRAVRYWASPINGEDGNGKKPGTNDTVIPASAIKRAVTGLSIQTGAPRLPNDNFGVSVLTNDHEYGKVLTEIIKNHIIDKTLGLTPIDWNTRYKTAKSVPPVRATPRPDNARPPSANFTSIAGLYNNDGYGQIEFCLLTPTPDLARVAAAANTSSCAQVTSNLTTILPNATRPGIPTLIAAVNGPWFSHIRLEHFNADLFNISLLISTPANDTAKPYWTFNDKSKSDNAIIGELDVNGTHIGLGFAGFWAGLWDGAEAGVPKPLGANPRERAEVYWDKISQ